MNKLQGFLTLAPRKDLHIPQCIQSVLRICKKLFVIGMD